METLTGLALYERHYSARTYRDGRERRLFVGPGEKVVLRTEAGDALFVWRWFTDDGGECGVNCAVFRNESPHQSSELIRQADAIADRLLALSPALHLRQPARDLLNEPWVLFSPSWVATAQTKNERRARDSRARP